MPNKNALGIIFPNMHDHDLEELTGHRTMASVPFAGRYRLIDFVLSGMAAAGMQNVGVIVKKNYQSLLDHIGNGREWDLSRKRGGLRIFPPNSAGMGADHHGRIEALNTILPYLEDSKEAYVLLSDCNIIATIDYAALIQKHIDTDADITILYSKETMEPALMKNNVSLELAPAGRVREMLINDKRSGKLNLSMGTMVVSRTLLIEMVSNAHSKGFSKFEQDIIAKKLDTYKVFGTEYIGYRNRIMDMSSFFAANMQMLYVENLNRLFPDERPVYTKVRDEPPVRYLIGSSSKNCTVADGCVIEGTVENSVLFRGCHIGKGAVVKNCILMQNTRIEADSRIEYVVTDKDCVVTKGQYLGGTKNYQVFIKKGSVV